MKNHVPLLFPLLKLFPFPFPNDWSGGVKPFPPELDASDGGKYVLSNFAHLHAAINVTRISWNQIKLTKNQLLKGEYSNKNNISYEDIKWFLATIDCSLKCNSKVQIKWEHKKNTIIQMLIQMTIIC